MTPWHRELLERNKTGQKQGNINFKKKKTGEEKKWKKLDQKTGYDQECNSNLAKPADHSDIMIKTVYQSIKERGTGGRNITPQIKHANHPIINYSSTETSQTRNESYKNLKLSFVWQEILFI